MARVDAREVDPYAAAALVMGADPPDPPSDSPAEPPSDP